MNFKSEFFQKTFLMAILSYVIFGMCCYSMAQTSENKTQNQSDNLETALNYGDETKTTGLVFVEYYYEEPGYGDTPEQDRIVGACLLKLDKSINMSNGISLKTLHLLFSDRTKMNCGHLLGKRVRVIGSLDEIHTGHHHGDALFDVKKYQILK